MSGVWFKNARLYRFLQPFEMSPEELAEKLEGRRFSECGRMQESSLGFVPPAHYEDAETGPLTHAANGFILFAVCRESRVLPPSVVREAAAERIEALEQQRGLKVAKRERDRITDDVRFELLSQAFTTQERTYAYIDPADGWLVVDASSDAKADALTDALHEVLGELPIAMPQTVERIASVMTRWLSEGTVPESFDLGTQCELRLPGEGGAIVRAVNQDLWSEELDGSLRHGKECVRLELTYAERVRFVLDEKLSVRRLRFLEIVRDQAEDVEAATPAIRLDSDFAILTLELRALINALFAVFGGQDLNAMGVES